MSCSEETLMAQAEQLAKDHGLYFKPVHEGPKGERLAYVLYRKRPEGGRRGIRIGRRETVSRLLDLIRHAAGIAGQTPARTEKETAL